MKWHRSKIDKKKKNKMKIVNISNIFDIIRNIIDLYLSKIYNKYSTYLQCYIKCNENIYFYRIIVNIINIIKNKKDWNKLAE